MYAFVFPSPFINPPPTTEGSINFLVIKIGTSAKWFLWSSLDEESWFSSISIQMDCEDNFFLQLWEGTVSVKKKSPTGPPQNNTPPNHTLGSPSQEIFLPEVLSMCNQEIVRAAGLGQPTNLPGSKSIDFLGKSGLSIFDFIYFIFLFFS